MSSFLNLPPFSVTYVHGWAKVSAISNGRSFSTEMRHSYIDCTLGDKFMQKVKTFKNIKVVNPNNPTTNGSLLSLEYIMKRVI